MITITYKQEGAAVHAYCVSDDKPPQSTDFFLSADQVALLAADPSVLDAKLTIAAKQNFTPPVQVIPPAPVQLRVTSPVDPTAAASLATAFAANQQTIAAGIASLNASIPKLATLPIAMQLSVLSQIQTIVNGVLPK